MTSEGPERVVEAGSATSLSVDRRVLATCWTWSGDAGPGWEDERSPIDLRTRVKAVAAAGWDGIGLVAADILEAQQTIGLSTLQQLIVDSGISIVELEFLTDWWTDDEPRRRQADVVRRLLFDVAPQFGATTIKAGADQSTPPVAIDAFATAFDELATDAGNHGVRVALEPMPMNNLRTLDQGAAFVSMVDNPHGGLCVDTWHVHRGGTQYAQLSEILNIEKVFVVELDDAREAVLGDTLVEDSNDWRLYPGRGEMHVAAFVANMVIAGWRGHWGVEIISAAHRALALDDAVRAARDATIETLHEAEILLSRNRAPTI